MISCHLRAPSICLFLANGWETTNPKETNQYGQRPSPHGGQPGAKQPQPNHLPEFRGRSCEELWMLPWAFPSRWSVVTRLPFPDMLCAYFRNTAGVHCCACGMRITPTPFSTTIFAPNGFEYSTTCSRICCAISGVGFLGIPSCEPGRGVSPSSTG
jgi:hypothetical protein